MGDKKIALCLSGKTTSSMFCFPYIYDAFINNGYNIDVFIHTWQQSRVLDLYNPKKIEIDKNDSSVIVNHFLSQLVLPENIIIKGSIPNVILEYYGNSKVFSMIDDTYDYVIRCRFDIIIQDKFNFSDVINTLESGNHDIFCPDEIFNFGGYQNRILIGKRKAMKYAMNLIENINILANQTGVWHPETFLKAELDNQNIKVFQKDINHRIVRSSSVVTNWPENPFKFLDL